MRIFIAGASGAIGRRLVPMLVQAGHDVTGMVRSERSAEVVRSFGADVAFADALDREAVARAVREARPEVVVHELTALADLDLRHFERTFAQTNRLRTEGTDHLLEATRAAGARRFIAQSFGGWTYGRIGTELKTEEDPFDPAPLHNQRKTLEAIRYLESATQRVPDLEGFVLRYANFYGPDTSFDVNGDVVALVRKRRLPIIGQGTGVWSFIHVDDAAGATIAAMERGAPDIYNVGDDEPTPVARWLPALAQLLDAGAPWHVPVWLGRLAVGDVGVSMMTQIRG